MRIAYIGDFEKGNGPSIVDIKLSQNIAQAYSFIYKIQINKNISLKEINELLKCDIINVSGVSLKGCLYSLVSKLLFKKVTCIVHGSLKEEKFYKEVSFIRRIEEKVQFICATKIIAVSDILAIRLKKNYKYLGKKIIYIYNGVEKIDTSVNKKKKYSILSVGGGRPEKGIIYICKAIEKLIEEDVDRKIRLIVVGEDGRDSEQIKKYSFVEYRDFQKKEELIKLMQESKIYIQNSIFESFGIAILEAYQCKCNIIVSNDCGIPENKFVRVQYNDIEQIKNAINYSINNDEHVEIDINKYSWSKVANDYYQIWLDLLNN